MEDNHKVVDHWKANIRPKLDSILQMRWSALGLLLLTQIEVCEIVRSKSGSHSTCDLKFSDEDNRMTGETHSVCPCAT